MLDWIKRVNLKNKKIAVLLGVVAIIIGVGSFVIWQNSNNSPDNVELEVDVDKENMVFRRVYLLSDKGLVVPLSVSFEKKDDLAEELVYITTLLREGSPLIKGNLRPVLNKDVKINRLEISNKVLTVDFSQEFSNYNLKDEIRILEALAWTYSQYKEVGSVKISVDNQPLTHMPVGRTPIPSQLSKSFGINNHVFRKEINTVNVITLYETEINDEIVYIPVTRGVELEGNLMNTVAKNITGKASIISGLQPVKELRDIELVNVYLNEDYTLELELGVSALMDESSISKELFDLIVIHFTSQINDIESVRVKVEGEVVQVSGYEGEDAIPVGNVIYNEIKL